jgi:hypothetical protein
MNTPRIKQFSVAAGAVIFAAIFVSLGVSNFALRRRLDIVEQQLRTRAARAAYRVGEVVPSFQAVDRNGRAITLGGAKPHDWVLVVVHPRCKYCKALVRTLSTRTAQPATASKDAQPLAIVSLAPANRAAELTTGAPAALPLYFLDRGTSLPGNPDITVVPQILRIGANGQVAKICSSIDQCTAGV